MNKKVTRDETVSESVTKINRNTKQKRKKRTNSTFSDNYIKSLKPENEMYQIREGRGFGIRILPTGTKIWTYTYTVAGKRRQMNLGHFYSDPDRAGHVSLADAHTKYRAVYDLVNKGVDPQVAPEPAVVPEPIQGSGDESMTIETLIDRYNTHMKATLVEKSVYDQYRTLVVDVLPKWNGRLIRDIKRAHAIKLLEEKSKTAPGQANNILKTARAMFSFALDRELIDANPFSRITKAVPQVKPKKRRRFLSSGEINYVWNKLYSEKMSLIQRILLLTLATGQRPGEVCSIEWGEIEFGQGHELCETCIKKCGWWTIPAAKIKTENRRDNPDPQPFRVYLSPLAVSLLPEQSPELRRVDIHWIFPSAGEEGPVRENSLSQYIQRKSDLKAMGWAPHDLRRTFSSHLPALQCTQEHIDRIQNHVIPGVGGIYNRYLYDNEKQYWELLWSLRLQELLETQ